LPITVDTRIGLRPIRSDSRPQNGSPKNAPIEYAEKISAICHAGASNDFA
jgi:hypothetical protein